MLSEGLVKDEGPSTSDLLIFQEDEWGKAKIKEQQACATFHGVTFCYWLGWCGRIIT